MFETWIAAITKPKETFAKEKSKASIMGGVKNFAIAGALYGIAYGLFSTLLLLLLGGGVAAAGIGIVAMIMTVVMMTIGFPIGSLVIIGIIHVIAKLLGGKGNYATDYYLMSTYSPVLFPLLVVPFLGFLLSIYQLYLVTMAIKESHGLGTGKAVLSWLLPGIIVLVFVVVVIGMAFLGVIMNIAAGAQVTPTPVA
ncbi:YIP1 family protein [Candidatus Micrarchaeota archaeon]|nr:YIP1 family protein [Candidatus Micrarchaeota archaeon]